MSAPALERMAEPVTSDSHYQTTIQPWDAMKAWMPPEQLEGFYRGNVIKYVARYDRKGGVDDLRKARRYIDQLIQHALEHHP
jgi:hypothetical protein